MKKYNPIKLIIMLFTFFALTGIVSAQDTYEFNLIPYNVTDICSFEEYGDGQACFNKYLNGDLDGYQINNKVVSANSIIMVVTEVTPKDSSQLTGIQYVINHDTSKVELVTNTFEDEEEPGETYTINQFGLLIYENDEGTTVNLGNTLGFFPSKKVNGKTYRTWQLNGDPYFGSNMVSILYNAGDKPAPLQNTTPLSATFYRVKEDVTPNSEILFTFDEDPSSTDIASQTGSLTDQATFNQLKLSVLSDVSNDGTLKTLTAKGDNNEEYLGSSFVPSSKKAEDLEYNIIVPNKVEKITFAGEATDEHIKGIIGMGEKNLTVGDNDFTITITAEDGTPTNYLMHVRRLSKDANIASIATLPNTGTLNFGTISDGTTTYTATAAYKTTYADTTISLNHTNAFVSDSGSTLTAKTVEGIPTNVYEGRWNFNTDNNTNTDTTFTVEVSPEECLYTSTVVPDNQCRKQTYTFTVTRTAPSKNLNLNYLKVDNVSVPGFPNATHEYTLDPVANSKTSVNITAELADDKNTISGTGNVSLSNVGANQLVVTVTSEDGETTQDYKINIYRKSAETALQSLTASSSPTSEVTSFSPTFPNSLTREYKYTYDPAVTSIDITAVAKDTGKAKVSIYDVTDSSNRVELVGATLNTVSTSVGNTVKKLEIIVTPEDETVTPLVYKLELDRPKSAINYLSALSINPGTITETFVPATGGIYHAEVEANVDSTTVSYTLSDTKASAVVSGQNGPFHFGSGNIITVAVTAENGDVKDYTIDVTRKKYTIATLDEIRVGFGDATPTKITGFNKDTFEYTLYTAASPLPYATNSINIEYDVTNEYERVSGDTGVKVVNTEDNTYVITVKSHEDAEGKEVTNQYKIHVYREQNSDNETKGVSVAGVAAHTKEGESDKVYYVTLPNSKNKLLASEVVISKSDDATLVKTTTEIDPLSTTEDNVFYYSITSQKGVTENYEIHITREKSADTSMTLVKLRLEDETTATRSCTFNPGSKTCTIQVPLGTTGYYLEPTIDPAATLTPAATTKYEMDANDPADSLQTRRLKVTAENSTEETPVFEEYIIVVERAKSSNADLSAITLTNVTGGKNENITINNFSASKTSYNITVPGDVEDVKIEATKDDEKATITTTLPQTITLAFNTNNQFTINVKAEDNIATKSYTLNITRLAKIDDTLKDLKVSVGTNTPQTINGFASNSTSYVYRILNYNETTFNIDAFVNDDASDDTDENAIIKLIKLNGYEVAINQGENVSVALPLSTDENIIEITVAAQNRTQTKTYTISVTRNKNSDIGIQGITVAGVPATVDDTDPYTYHVTVGNDITKADSTNVIVTPNAGETDYDALATYGVSGVDPLITLNADKTPKENEVSVTVTAEDGTTKVYTVKVIRTPSNIAQMNSINLYTDVAPTRAKQCIFSGDTVTCDLNVEMTTTSFTINGVLEDSASSVDFSDGVVNGPSGTEFTMGSTESSKTITAIVTAENGTTTKTYTINITRNESSNSYLKTLKTNANQTNPETLVEVDGFSDSETNYSITVPGTTSSIKIYAETDDPKATITGDGIETPASIVTITKTLNYGTNVIKLTGVAENGTNKTLYTITVTKERNTERRLSNIYINGDPIDNYMTGVTFNPDTFEYTLNILDYSDSVVSITADSMDVEHGTVDGTGSHNIQTIFYDNHDNDNKYVNDITIKSMAHNTSLYYNYVLHITRNPSNKTNLSKVEVLYDGDYHEATYNTSEGTYSITVPNSYTEANNDNIKVTGANGLLTTDNKATATVTTTNIITLDTSKNHVANEVPILVTAEDGTTTKTVKLYITRELSDEARLNDIKIVNPDDQTTVIGTLDPVFNPDTLDYTVIVPADINKVFVKYEKKEENQTVNNDGEHDLTSSSMEIKITSISEDGNRTKVYKLNIKRIANNDNAISALTVTGDDSNTYSVTPEVSATTTRYYVTVPGTVNAVTLDVTKNHELATLEYINPDAGTMSTYTIPVGITTIQFVVTSESKTPQKYYLEVTREPKTDATLKNLSYTLIKSDNTTEVGVIDLTTPDENDNTWIITDLSNDYTRINISAQPNDDNAVVSGSINRQAIAVGDNTYDIVVTAEDGVTQKHYYIKTHRNYSNDATLKALDAPGYSLDPTFAPGTGSYSFTVNETHDTFSCDDLSYLTNHPQATVTCDAEMNLSTTETNTFKLTVTAEDRTTTKDYILNITRPKSTDNKLKNITLVNGSLSPGFRPNLDEYTITIPYGETTFSIEGIKNVESQTVIGNGEYNINDLDDGTLTLTVQAEDPTVSVHVYTFHVINAQSNDGTLSDLYVSGYPFVPTGTNFSPLTYTYSIGDIDRAINQLKVYATPNNVNAKVEYIYDTVVSSCTNQLSCQIDLNGGLGEKNITVRVTPADESTANIREYVIKYNKVSSSNSNLVSITSDKGTFDKGFNAGTKNYTLTVPNEHDSVTLSMVSENLYANISAEGTNNTHEHSVTISGLEVGVDRTVNIVVTPEVGKASTYIVVVRRLDAQASDDNLLSSLSVTDYAFKNPNSTFNPTINAYNIGQIPYNLTELTINATANSPTATISYYVDGVIQTSNIVTIPKSTSSTIQVKVTAENGEANDYTITLTKNPNNDATLKNLIVSEGTLDPAFDATSSVRTYTVTVPNETTSINVTAMLNDTNATASLNGKVYTSGNATTVNLLVGSNTETFVITAENGITVQTYKLNIIREGVDEVITSVRYGHTIEDGYIKTAKLYDTASQMKDQLDNDNSKLEIWDALETSQVADGDPLATGMIVKLIVGGREVDRKIIIVLGDTNGDADIDLADAVKILNHYLEDELLTGPYLEAADCNHDEDVDLADAVKILNHYLEDELLH